MSETSTYRHLCLPYCAGTGLDIGSGGDPVAPWAIQVDLPTADYEKYNQVSGTRSIHLPTGCLNLPFKDQSLDFVYSSHLIEDFLNWDPLLTEWTRVVKPGGFIVIMLPDKQRFTAAIGRGQPPNCAHQHEGRPGEVSEHFRRLGFPFHVQHDWFTDLHANDYNILFVARRA